MCRIVLWKVVDTYFTYHKFQTIFFFLIKCSISNRNKYCHMSQWLKMGFGLVIGFIIHLQPITAMNYYTVAALHNLRSLHTNLFSLSALVWLISRSSSDLSCDRSIASSKLSSPKSVILSILLQLPVSSCFLQVIQQLLTSSSSPSCPYNLSFNDVT
jgi:hypothetical protein